MPTINLEQCIGCLKCVNDCPSNAINIESGTIEDSCIHCEHCVAICPQSAILPDRGTIEPLKKHGITSTDFSCFSSSIRSCRNFQKKDISTATIQKLINQMAHYPSASNARPIKITVVQSQEKIKLLNDSTTTLLINKLKLATSPYILPLIRMFAPSLNVSGIKKYKESLIRKSEKNDSMICYHAPAVLLFHGPKSKMGMAESDALIWASHTSLYANSMGLGTCFNGFIVKAMEGNKTFKKAFNIPLNHEVYSALLLGHSNVKYSNKVTRKGPDVEFV